MSQVSVAPARAWYEEFFECAVDVPVVWLRRVGVVVALYITRRDEELADGGQVEPGVVAVVLPQIEYRHVIFLVGKHVFRKAVAVRAFRARGASQPPAFV